MNPYRLDNKRRHTKLVTLDIKEQYNNKTRNLEYHMCYILTKRCCVYATALEYAADEDFYQRYQIISKNCIKLYIIIYNLKWMIKI